MHSVAQKLAEADEYHHGWEEYKCPFNQPDLFEYDRDDGEQIPIDREIEDDLQFGTEEERFFREQRASHHVLFSPIVGEAALTIRRQLVFNPIVLGNRLVPRRMTMALD
ncbi:hypothetical protein GOP47_0023002 [Adiantum capillus-veneris]|uniref:Uncharacterized protein n=1 Tax=Adiantum capillus-veneris TaxID=13818 RepID=A0A9D4U7J9_ADICA|nr:hypothetical protein GOP47_0023002 [Adiantum capillus-veneris]